MTTLDRHADALHRPGSWLFVRTSPARSSTLVARDPRHGKPRYFAILRTVAACHQSRSMG